MKFHKDVRENNGKFYSPAYFWRNTFWNQGIKNMIKRSDGGTGLPGYLVYDKKAEGRILAI